MAPTRKNAIQAVRAFEPATYAKDVSGFMGMDIKDHQLSGVVANLAVAKKMALAVFSVAVDPNEFEMAPIFSPTDISLKPSHETQKPQPSE